MNRTFLVTFGYNLDHSNLDHLVSDRLAKYKGGIQKDYFQPVLHRHAELILNYQIVDTNEDRVSHKYYLNDYHITNRQLQGFLYSLRKLKGKHVLCNPYKQGHQWTTIDEIEYSTYAYETLEGTDLRFFEYVWDPDAEAIVRQGLKRVPEHKRYLEFPADYSNDAKDKLLTDWFLALIREGGNGRGR